MIGTIGYLVEVDRTRWIRAISSFTIASIISGAATGAFVWLAANWVLREIAIPHSVAFIAIVAPLGFAYAAALTGRIALPYHGVHRQVPKIWWDDYGPIWGAALFGLQLGAGFFTVVPQASYWVLLAWVATVPDLTTAASAMALFAFCMSSTVWLGSLLAHRKFDVDHVSLFAIRNAQTIMRVNAVMLAGTVALGLTAVKL